MTKNPIINALAATLYISIVASIMFYGQELIGPDKNILVPIMMISLFTLSAAMMGYIFLSQSIQLYLAGEKSPAVRLFLQTLATFAFIIFIILAILFFT